MKFIKENYLKVWKFLKENLGNTIRICTIIFLISALVCLLIGFYKVEMIKPIIQSLTDSKSEVLIENGKISDVGLIKNNTIACGISIVYGIIPFIFLTMIPTTLNGFILGIVLGLGKATSGASALAIFIVGILPHGIFELPALIISMAMGMYLCLNLTLKIFRRGKEKIYKILLEYVRIFVLVILPMLILAGVIEAYITPLLLQ